jgi:CheY-like chemotaxis protein/signal transduction histidine kinase/HAMP domain-containing protein
MSTRNGASNQHQLLSALRALKKGDFSVRLPNDQTGLPGAIAEAFNEVVELIENSSDELDQISRVVGKEGRINQRMALPLSTGGWIRRTNAVNSLITDLVQPTVEVSRVIGAVARGDLGQRMTLEIEGRPLQGEFLRIGTTVNTMVDQLGSFASEVTRVAREVGSEGKLGGQAVVEGVAGTWKDLTDNVNSMASNLTSQVRNIAQVTTAVANGDLSRKITVDVKGEILELKNTINTMVDQLGSFASEVTRVAREVGTEGKLGGQAIVKGVAGVWKDLTDSVNSMASNLTSQVRNIAGVTTAVANGDLSRKITVDVKGEILELKNTINTMVDQLGSFASEVTRVARDVGTEGRLGGQAQVRGVGGVWKDLTDNVNSMAGNLTAQVRNIAEVTTAVANGNLGKKVTADVRGEILELKNTINAMVDQLNSFASEVTRVAREVGTEGRLGGQAQVRDVAGVWKDLTDSVNSMASNLTSQVRNIADVTTAVANGNLRKKVTVDVRGEILELKNTINAMVDQLNSFASEVTRVAREVGTEGILGGQADVKGVSGTWKDLTDSVNSMAANLTGQVRGIAKVVTAVANGDLKQQLTVEAKGEIAALADTINSMIDTLATFADQVTSVAREVGVEGELGGQAMVPGAAGTWKGLTENVNQLAANLTIQVRAIAEVATAVTKGDLTRSITVEAQGEVAALKDTINEMIRNLKDTTQKNTEQDWLKTNLAKFTRTLQGQRDLTTVTKLILSELAPVVSAQHGGFYLREEYNGTPVFKLNSSYAYRERKGLRNEFKMGEGLVGECAFEKERILITEVPGDYIRVSSGLGEAPPMNIVVLPVLFEGQVKAVVELASFNRFKDIHIILLDQLSETIGIVLHTVETNLRTEGLLKQSQSLAQELTSQQEELRQTNARLEKQASDLRVSEDLLKTQQENLKSANEELEHKAGQLASQNAAVEAKNREIELAKLALQERAEQLAMTGKYKSEFLANMSHELRTPLNSLLILAEMLAADRNSNLTPKQQEFAKTIYSSGSDLLSLINDILDMAKIESGTMRVEIGEVLFNDLREYVERTFRPVADNQDLQFMVEMASDLSQAMQTDGQRLQQVLRNLLSNAFKFTKEGKVTLHVHPADHGWSTDHPALSRSRSVVAFAVHDTGIGIAADKLRLIFEPFQQADSGSGRHYSGTGLGLSISREMARLLGGEIRVQSIPGEGSTFTLYLPLVYQGAEPETILQKPEIRTSPLRAVQELPPQADLDVSGDVGLVRAGDRILLIVERDPTFAQILLQTAHEQGLRALIVPRGEKALALAKEIRPAAITLDLSLPDLHGWNVLQLLKEDPRTSHIPVHIISGDESGLRGLERGAVACLKKPVKKSDLDDAFAKMKKGMEAPIKRLLIVEDNDIEREHVVKMVAEQGVHVTAVGTGADALTALRSGRFDCLILDLMLPDIPGLELVEQIRKELGLNDLPVIVYTGKELTQEDDDRLEEVAQKVIVKDVRSLERLREETTAFLNRITSRKPDAGPPVDAMVTAQSKLPTRPAETLKGEASLAGKKVLVVDDDIRNLFALMSMLERFGAQVLRAESGPEALRILGQHPNLDIVLMDIMMAGMDGYETTRAIRRQARFRSLPIIALTAKAMKGDREKCLEAGASDYLAKPVTGDRLLSVLGSWLSSPAEVAGVAT